MRLLLDADATLHLLKLSLWQLLLDANVPLVITGYVARHELSSVWSDKLEPLAAKGKLVVEDVMSGTDAWQRRKDLIKQGNDKGEAEAIAWAQDHDDVVFVSCDERARKTAQKHDLPAVDLGDLAALLVVEDIATEAAVLEKIEPWDGIKSGLGRPNPWDINKPALKGRIGLMKKRRK